MQFTLSKNILNTVLLQYSVQSTDMATWHHSLLYSSLSLTCTDISEEFKGVVPQSDDWYLFRTELQTITIKLRHHAISVIVKNRKSSLTRATIFGFFF